MPIFTPSQVVRLLEKHGLPVCEPVKGSFEGVVNEIWFAGDVVVRINKDLNYESDVWTETVAVPALMDKGIRTPRLLAFDGNLDIVDRLVTIYERMPGIPLSQVDDLLDPEGFFFQLGQEIRRFHEAVKTVDDPDNRLDPAWFLDESSVIKRYGIPIEGIAQALGEEPVAFCHEDLHPDNILVHGGKLSAILDWGDAGWGAPSADFRFIPARYFESVLEGYGSASRATPARGMLHLIEQYFYCQDNSRSYGLYGDSTKDEVDEAIVWLAKRL